MPASFRAATACLTVLAMVSRKAGLKQPIGVIVSKSNAFVQFNPIILVENDPAGKIQPGATALDLADGKGHPGSVGQLRRDGTEALRQVQRRCERRHKPVAPCGPTLLSRRLAAPQIEKPADLPRLKHCQCR
jgi:hypothetical protein